MTDEEKIATLEGALRDPAESHRHDQIAAKLSTLKGMTSSGRPGELGGEGPPAGPGIRNPPEPTIGERLSRGAERLAGGADQAARFANRIVDTATMGYYGRGMDALSRLTGTRVGTSPEQAAEFSQQHPWAAGTADAAGYLAPEGLPGKLGSAVGRGVDALTSALARRGAQATGAGRVATKALGNAAAGAGTAGTIRLGEGLARGETPEQAGGEALDAAKSGAVMGGGLGVAGGVGGEAAAAARRGSKDLQILHRHGLEPGPIPGRPIIREDQSVMSQFPGRGEPPLGVRNANPETRTAASRGASEAIVPDIAERARLNNQRFGELQSEAYATEGMNPSAGTPVLNAIDAHLQNLRLPTSTRGALEDLRAKVIGNGTSTRGGHFVSAEHMDQLRDYADGLGRQEKAARASDVPLRQVADIMRASVAEAAPGIAHLNALQHEVLSGFEERRALLRIPRPGSGARGAGASEATREAVAQRISQTGEETKAGGKTVVGGRSAAERFGDMGAPPTLPGTRGLPPEPNYQAHLEVPRLQLAQENVQLTPGKTFSGARSEHGLAFKAGMFAPTRVGYPLARRLGDSSIGTKPLAADALIQALRSRGRKRQEERP